MVVSLLVNKIKHLVLFFVSVFRRALCCFRRRRRVSVDSVPLTHVVSNPKDIEENWAWDEKPDYSEPKTVQDHIELYRKRKVEAQQQAEVPPEERLDFFEDMAPKITKQTKVFINTDRGAPEAPSRLNLIDAVPVVSGELQEWEENSGWEGETLDWDAQQALREKRRQDREKRLWEQQQKRQEKMNRALGARIST
ncbi:receptor-binding cancer antigen expressed on SiSo cells [Tribolium castaneum]|uniref:Receptor-binding cancer antigen expressed on SiSo cells-like Protein n=1 Tax=Tribolium castaneum TaxID=7070 RepID=D6X3Z3_TRICA|nr:PREDICTED: receptor-binding cancer antigen expressed on SiSo cells [Tribolium castaneum]EEZ97347.1 Receptor-binding cancer antigen expressed on SiSo cells-like Protein [Tribolium castaneum]|eukprot:XP_969683.1 PREDICTED: receptor-binding cancer antigen expressed on SiSo cells [Tribolium castaneum]